MTSENRLWYYDQIFPLNELEVLVGGAQDFPYREFAFRWTQGPIKRHRGFETVAELRKALVKDNQATLNVGAAYLYFSDDPLVANPQPWKKELVFDIDLSDYNDVRTCCDGCCICHKCWKLVEVAMQIITLALKHNFGYRQVVWFFSGRRGVHGWVTDESARCLDDDLRKAVLAYMTGEMPAAWDRPLPPQVEMAARVIVPRFEEVVLKGQDPWDTEMDDGGAEYLVNQFDHLVGLREHWVHGPASLSREKWAEIEQVESAANGDTRAKIERTKLRVMFHYMFPRLDTAVTAQTSHLLKAPFSVHDKTGNICVPIIEGAEFKLENVPTLEGLVREYSASQEASQKASQKASGDAYKKTSLAPYIEWFQAYLARCLEFRSDDARARRHGIVYGFDTRRRPAFWGDEERY